MHSISNDMPMSLIRQKQFRDEKILKFLSKYNKIKQKNLNCKLISKKRFNCIKPVIPESVIVDRASQKIKSWHLPPNIYNIDSIRTSVNIEGNKGAYISKLRRTNSSIISHKRERPLIGEFKYYNKLGLSDILNEKIAHSKLIKKNISIASEKIKPVSEITIPKHSITNINNVQKSIKKQKLYKFYDRTSVPVTENLIHANAKPFTPDALFYYPYNNTDYLPNKTYLPNIHNLIEKNKILKYRHLQYDKKIYNLSLKTISDDKYKIKGDGYRSRFHCPLSCKNTILPLRHTKDVLTIEFDHKYYLNIINKPQRKPNQYRREKKLILPIKFNYCSTGKIAPKKKVENNKLAFSSTQSSRPNTLYNPLKMRKKDTKEITKKVPKKMYPNVEIKYLKHSPKTNIVLRKSLTLNYGKMFKKTSEKQLVSLDEVFRKSLNTIKLHKHFLSELEAEDFFKDSEKQAGLSDLQIAA